MIYKNLSYVAISFFYINIIGYFFHFYVSRKLGPALYGEFMVLYSIYLTMANISGIVGNVAVKKIVENINNKYETLRFLRIFGVVTGIIISVFLVTGCKDVLHFLNIGNRSSVYLIAFGILILFPTSLEKSFLQSTKQFGFFSILNSAELTIRLVMAILFLYFGLKVFGALLSSVVSIFISLAVLLYKNNNIMGKINKIPIKNILYLMLYISPGGVMVYLDSIFIKKMFDPTTAGLYAAFSVLGKAVLFLCLTLNTVFFPEFISLRSNINKLFKMTIKSNFLVFAIFILSIVGVSLSGKELFLIVFGAKYTMAFKYLPYYLLALLPLTLNIYFMSIFTALEKHLIIMYANFLIYLCGFVFLRFKTIDQYFLYIGITNLIFYLFYLGLFTKLKIMYNN